MSVEVSMSQRYSEARAHAVALLRELADTLELQEKPLEVMLFVKLNDEFKEIKVSLSLDYEQ